MVSRKLPQIIIVIWIAVASFYTLYGWFGELDHSYPIFVFVYHTVVPVALILLPIVGALWLFWLSGREANQLKLLLVALFILIGNGLALSTVIRIAVDDTRYHGHLWFEDGVYFLGSQWIPGGEGQSGAIYSAYDCDLVFIDCYLKFREVFSMGFEEFETMNAALIVENEIPKITIDGKGSYVLRP